MYIKIKTKKEVLVMIVCLDDGIIDDKYSRAFLKKSPIHNHLDDDEKIFHDLTQIHQYLVNTRNYTNEFGWSEEPIYFNSEIFTKNFVEQILKIDFLFENTKLPEKTEYLISTKYLLNEIIDLHKLLNNQELSDFLIFAEIDENIDILNKMIAFSQYFLRTDLENLCDLLIKKTIVNYRLKAYKYTVGPCATVAYIGLENGFWNKSYAEKMLRIKQANSEKFQVARCFRKNDKNTWFCHIDSKYFSLMNFLLKIFKDPYLYMQIYNELSNINLHYILDDDYIKENHLEYTLRVSEILTKNVNILVNVIEIFENHR